MPGLRYSHSPTTVKGVSSGVELALAAHIEGVRDLSALADLAVYSMRAKIPALIEALKQVQWPPRLPHQNASGHHRRGARGQLPF
jgi:hypothetical protein